MSQTHGSERVGVNNIDIIDKSLKTAAEAGANTGVIVAGAVLLVALELAKYLEPKGYVYPSKNNPA